MADSSFSLSLPSQPPNIRNWFSSYEYESPVLDLSDDLKCISSEETDEEKDDNLNLGRFKDLKDGCLLGAGKRPYGDGEECENSEQETQPLNTDDHHLIENDESPFQLKNLPSRKITEDEVLQHVSLRKCNSIPLEDDGDSRKWGKISIEELNEDLAGRSDLAFSKTTSNSREHHEKSMDCLPPAGDCKEGMLKRREMKKVDDASPRRGSASKGLDGSCAEKSCSSRDKEEGENFTKDGFISTKKHENRKKGLGVTAMKPMPRMKHENQCTGKQLAMTTHALMLSENKENYEEMSTGNAGLALQDSNRKLACEGSAPVRRVSLSERTNFLAEESPRITRKWQCPRKNKPNLGPPMKQL